MDQVSRARTSTMDDQDLIITLVPHLSEQSTDKKGLQKMENFKKSRSGLWKVMKHIFSLQVYKVLIRNGDKCWFLFRRYNEFYGLHEKVSIISIFIPKH